jgi:hypothetical protein
MQREHAGLAAAMLVALAGAAHAQDTVGGELTHDDKLALALRGDLNADGYVDDQDFKIVAENFGLKGSDIGLSGDMTNDGLVDFDDLQFVVDRLGSKVSQSPIDAPVAKDLPQAQLRGIPLRGRPRPTGPSRPGKPTMPDFPWDHSEMMTWLLPDPWEPFINPSNPTAPPSTTPRPNPDHVTELSRGGHALQLSWTHPNHSAPISETWDHGTGDSLTWPPNHGYTVSEEWDPWGPWEHSVAVSRSWPPHHQKEISSTWNPKDTVPHAVTLSSSWPPDHNRSASLNRTPPDHSTRFSADYEPGVDHDKNLSQTWPPRHFRAVSATNPEKHSTETSTNWPPNHWGYVSVHWPKDPNPGFPYPYPPNTLPPAERPSTPSTPPASN